MSIRNENEAYADLLCGHLYAMVHRLRKLPEDKWDWTPDVAAPTARTLADHTYQWLICDRQHIEEPNTLLHPRIPDAPRDPQAMCNALAEESERWKTLILGLTTEELNADRKQFDDYTMTVRDFVCHMVQNTIYKSGQFATLYFALGLDGTAPYDAPFPNPLYDALHRGETVRAERAGENFDTFRASFASEDVPSELLEKVYALLSTRIARGIPVRADDTLRSIFLLSQPENVLDMYGGVPVRHLIAKLAADAGYAAPAADADLSAAVTAHDLVRVVAQLERLNVA